MSFPHTPAASWEQRNEWHVWPILRNPSPVPFVITPACRRRVRLLLLLVISFAGKGSRLLLP